MREEDGFGDGHGLGEGDGLREGDGFGEETGWRRRECSDQGGISCGGLAVVTVGQLFHVS